MRNELMYPIGRHRRLLSIATIIALLGAGVAGAVDTAPVVTPQKTSMTFPHVRVVNTPELAAPSATTTGQLGLRAYIDPATGELRPPTQEDLLTESLEAQQAAALNPPAGGIALRYHAETGAIGFHVGDSQMVFAVVQKQESGELTEFCVVGPEQATKLLNLKAPSLSALQRKGDRSDR